MSEQEPCSTASYTRYASELMLCSSTLQQGAAVEAENGGVLAVSTGVLWEGKLSVVDGSSIVFGGTALKIFSQSIQ